MEKVSPTDLALRSEERLIEAARLDPQAFGTLYQLYRPRVYRYLRIWVGNAEEADDLAQDVFLRAMVALPGYRPNGAPFLAWLMRIARNRALDRLRAARRRPLLSLEAQAESGMPEAWDPVASSPGSLPVEELSRVELRQRLLAALEQLPEDQRVAVILVDIEGLTYDEAAAMAAVPAGTLKSRLSRGRARLRALLLADERSRELIEMGGVREGQQGEESPASS